VTAFGVNAIVLPAGVESQYHVHDEQEELYFVHSGTAEISFGDGTVHRLEAGGLARVDPSTPRKLRAVGEQDLVFVCVGGKDGYVPRDGRLAD
jgi:mannose-6-phosphate isomerase-like protein (cupin superfamily)